MRILGVLFAASLGITTPAVPNGAAQDDPGLQEDLAACARDSAAAVQERYEAVGDLEARFEQQTRSVALGTGAAASATTSAGRVLFAKPGRMRWDYERPRPSLVVSNGEVMWLYDPDSSEAQRLPVTSGYLNGAALSFLVGEGRLTDEFEVGADECGASVAQLTLKPRTDASYERLGLEVDRATGEVHATSIVDVFGNITVVRFQDLRTNQAPSAASFEFAPPVGTQVIDLVP